MRLAGQLKDSCVCEVGPGPGSLTRSVLNASPRKVVVVEKDRRFLPSLEVRLMWVMIHMSSIGGLQMSHRCPTSGGQTHNQKATIQWTFHLWEKQFLLSALSLVGIQCSAYLPVFCTELHWAQTPNSYCLEVKQCPMIISSIWLTIYFYIPLPATADKLSMHI